MENKLQMVKMWRQRVTEDKNIVKENNKEFMQKWLNKCIHRCLEG